MFLETLSQNTTMAQAVRKAAADGMPIYAECGGLMYLCEAVTDFEDITRPMVGLVPAKSVMQAKLQKVGYVTATALEDTLLAPKGESLRGHEFHFSTMELTENADEADFPWAFQFEGGRKPQSYKGGYSKDNILASYLHLNFAGNEDAAERFVAAAKAYRAKEARHD